MKELLSKMHLHGVVAQALDLCRQPSDAARPRPGDATDKCPEDILIYLLDVLVAADLVDSIDLVLDYLAWAQGLFATLGLPAEHLPAALHQMAQSIEDHGDFYGARLAQLLRRAQQQLTQGGATVTALANSDQPLGPLAQRYLAALLAGQEAAAETMLIAAVERGMTIAQLYLQVFAPVMHHIGRLWSDNRVTVAQEYVVATASQAHMARLYPRICAEAPRGPLLVAACVEGDLHEIGLRMVADLFQLDGWDVRFLGGDTPATVVAAFVDHVDADVVAISAMLATHVPQVVAQVALLRSGAGAARRRILVGGYPFKVDRTLWRRIGADGCGDDAPAALALALGWLGSQRPRLVGRV